MAVPLRIVIAAALATACSQSAAPSRSQPVAPERAESGGIIAQLSSPPAPTPDAGTVELEVDLPDDDAGPELSLPYSEYEFDEVAEYRPMPRRFVEHYTEGNPMETGVVMGRVSLPAASAADCPNTSSALVFLSGVDRGRSLFTKSPGVHDHRRHQIGGLLERDACGLSPRVQVVMPMGAMLELVNRGEEAVDLIGRAASHQTSGELGSPLLGGSREAFRAPLAGPGARTYRRLDEAGLYEVSAGDDIAWVAVAPHPYYVAVSIDGDFRLDGVPAGSYTLVVWSARGAGQQPRVIRRRVNVQAGKATRLAL